MVIICEASRLKDILAKYGMLQLVNEPTHFVENSSSLIDLVICNKASSVELVHVGPPFLPTNIRYHSPVYGALKFHKPSNTCFKRKIWLYDRGDYDLFRQRLSDVNWHQFIESSNNVDTLVSSFSKLFLNVASEAIPNKIVTVRKHDPPWMNNIIRKAIRRRNRAHKRAKKLNSPDHWEKFRKFRNKVVNAIRKEKSVYYDKLIEKLCSQRNNVKEWWKLASKVTGFKSKDPNIPPIIVNDALVDDGVQKAEAFNAYFSSQSRIVDDNKSLPAFDYRPPNRCLSRIVL